MGTAREIRAAVEQAGGRLDTTVRELRDAFGVTRLTATGRQRITDELRRAKLRLEPPLEQCQLDDPITVVDARRRAAKQPAFPAPQRPSAAPPPLAAADAGDPWKAAKARFATEAEAAGRRRASSGPGWTKRGGVILGGAVALVVVIMAAIFGGGDGDTSAPAPNAPPVPVEASLPADLRAQAISYLGEANALILADDAAAARSYLADIDARVLAEEPALQRRVTRSRKVVRMLERYLDAQALAVSGSYLAARQEMLAVASFRDARRRADAYATKGAQKLVAQARGVYVSQPGRALGLLTRAESLDPGLGAIEDLRARAFERQAELAAPPEPAPAPEPVAPAASACDPNYSGACVPVVPYDLNCDDVPASNFASIGSDPHGFDREGDGLACE